MPQPDRPRGTRVALYGRATLPPPARDRRDRLAERLSGLVAAGSVDGLEEETWPKRIPRDEAADARARDRYLAFESWARDAEVSLAPFFGTRTCYSTATGDRGEWVVFPALCLAVHEDGELTGVYPHADGEENRTVGDGVDALAGGDDGTATDDRERRHRDEAVGPAD